MDELDDILGGIGAALGLLLIWYGSWVVSLMAP